MISYEKFEKSIDHLRAQWENYQHLGERAALSALDREAIAESVIQRFETCYDSLWKALKRYLREELGLPDPPNSPKPVLRIAFENDLLPSNIEQWLEYANARTNTAHDYSGEKAKEALQIIPLFLADAQNLFQKIADKNVP